MLHNEDFATALPIPTPIIQSITSQKAVPARKKKKNGSGHISRPPNKFMLYRSWCISEGLTSHIKKQQDISAHAGSLWKQADSETMRKFTAMADEEKRRHHEMYPDYRYAPSKHDGHVNHASAVALDDSKVSMTVAGTTRRKSQVKKRTRRASAYYTPSPTNSPPPDEGNGTDGGEDVARQSCQYTVCEEETEKREDEEDEEDGIPLFSLWTGKFENMPRLVGCLFDSQILLGLLVFSTTCRIHQDCRMQNPNSSSETQSRH